MTASSVSTQHVYHAFAYGTYLGRGETPQEAADLILATPNGSGIYYDTVDDVVQGTYHVDAVGPGRLMASEPVGWTL